MNITLTTAHDYPLEYTFPDTTHQVVYFFTVENIGVSKIYELITNFNEVKCVAIVFSNRSNLVLTSNPNLNHPSYVFASQGILISI